MPSAETVFDPPLIPGSGGRRAHDGPQEGDGGASGARTKITRLLIDGTQCHISDNIEPTTRIAVDCAIDCVGLRCEFQKRWVRKVIELQRKYVIEECRTGHAYGFEAKFKMRNENLVGKETALVQKGFVQFVRRGD